MSPVAAPSDRASRTLSAAVDRQETREHRAPKKVKRAYYKASRFVHPDKLVNLSTEQKFIGKRVFDALSQAYADFENGNSN